MFAITQCSINLSFLRRHADLQCYVQGTELSADLLFRASDVFTHFKAFRLLRGPHNETKMDSKAQRVWWVNNPGPISFDQTFTQLTMHVRK